MDDSISGKNLKKIGESLARFADVRGTAQEPRDRVVVQAAAGMIKVVAGASYGTIIATVHATTQQFRAVISARELLNKIKSLSPKEEYKFEDLNKGFEVGCSLAGTDFLRLSTGLPVFLLPPDITAQSQGYVDIPADAFMLMGNMFAAVADPIRNSPVNVAGNIYTHDDSVKFSATDDVKFASVIFKGKYEVFGKISADTLDAARAIGDVRMSFWTDGKMVLESEGYKVIGPYSMLETYGPMDFPPGKLARVEHKVVAEKTKLLKSMREHAKLDSATRVVLQLDHNGSIKVDSYENASHGWFVKSEYMSKILAAVPTKQVGIGLRTGRGQPINVRIPDWTIELAPVELKPAK